eukprot:CAMPEP_0183797260 /NCGR_PEP_ID=MMETSP0803_2-20130417/15120_1 /TAXON_ID=195967 /ORGANISM="Crustomastix stigmata, Strain CCMP3273" /LENGTH=59 /DNA_ID=CAMNT_0026041927 /DNA_START=1 /DNA_END=177 /DNA_ORIENTATION=+
MAEGGGDAPVGSEEERGFTLAEFFVGAGVDASAVAGVSAALDAWVEDGEAGSRGAYGGR